MKAVVYERYGPPEVLELRDLPEPTPGDGEVVVRVRAAGTNAGDWHLMRGDPFLVRLVVGGITRPKHPVLGGNVAGTVEAVGPGVTDLAPGDDVVGELSEYGYGGFAEQVRGPATAFVRKPEAVSFVEGAALPTAGITALQALRDGGGLKTGERVLVNGASGGVGTFAVQIAKVMGAHVTGVCSTRNLELVGSIGADEVVDYTRTDITEGGARFDLVIDVAAFRSFMDYRGILTPGGRYVLVGGAPARTYQIMLLGPLVSMVGDRTMKFFITQPTSDDLKTLLDWMADGRIRTVLDRTYPLAEVPEAIRYLETGRARGKVVIGVP